MINMTVASAFLVSLVGLGGTGDDGGGSQQQQQQPPSQQQQQQPQQQASPIPSSSLLPSPSPSGESANKRALYFANLKPLNGSDVTGHAGVVVDGSSVGVSLQASGLAANLAHPQFLQPGGCSSGSDNSDISEQSNVPISGGFPLNLANQKGGFPISSENGNLTYIQSFSEDSVANDIATNGLGKSLDLGGDVIEILGANSQPLACGKLFRSPE